MTIESLAHLDTHRRRKIEAALRAIRQGGRSLALLAAAAEVAVHDNYTEAADQLREVWKAMHSIDTAADEIRRELNQ